MKTAERDMKTDNKWPEISFGDADGFPDGNRESNVRRSSHSRFRADPSYTHSVSLASAGSFVPQPGFLVVAWHSQLVVGSPCPFLRRFSMPLFEFLCQSCEAEFELLVGVRETPVCPECQSRKLDKLMSAASGRVTGNAFPMASDCPPPEAGPCSPSCCRLPQG